MPRGKEAKISGDVWPISVRSFGVGTSRRGCEKRVREVEGREKERGWCPRMRESRVVLPEPVVVSGVCDNQPRERTARGNYDGKANPITGTKTGVEEDQAEDARGKVR
jgi:hypothetical protein